MLRRITKLAHQAVDTVTFRLPPLGANEAPRGESLTRGIIFSCDRPMQLDALIRSYRRMVTHPCPLDVIHRGTSSGYRAAYAQLAETHRPDEVRFWDEESLGGFKTTLVEVLAQCQSRTVFFLVDDIVFIRPYDLGVFAGFATDFVVPSMRLGLNIRHSYMRNRPQPRPRLHEVNQKSDYLRHKMTDEDLLWMWRWRSGSIDWSYPFSLDGNIFMTEMIRGLVQSGHFHGPNSLEIALHDNTSRLGHLWGLCFGQSRLVNVPLNRVQNEVNNASAGTNPDELLAAWGQGLRLDISGLAEVRNISVHEDLALPLRRSTP